LAIIPAWESNSRFKMTVLIAEVIHGSIISKKRNRRRGERTAHRVRLAGPGPGAQGAPGETSLAGPGPGAQGAPGETSLAGPEKEDNNGIHY
jgi:hypothetical protein